MADLADTPVVGPDTTLDQVIGHLHSSETERVIIAGGGRLHGALTLAEVSEWVGRANKLGLDQPGPGTGEADRGSGGTIERERKKAVGNG